MLNYDLRTRSPSQKKTLSKTSTRLENQIPLARCSRPIPIMSKKSRFETGKFNLILNRSLRVHNQTAEQFHCCNSYLFLKKSWLFCKKNIQIVNVNMQVEICQFGFMYYLTMKMQEDRIGFWDLFTLFAILLRPRST